jgi:hypothetical protein
MIEYISDSVSIVRYYMKLMVLIVVSRRGNFRVISVMKPAYLLEIQEFSGLSIYIHIYITYY